MESEGIFQMGRKRQVDGQLGQILALQKGVDREDVLRPELGADAVREGPFLCWVFFDGVVRVESRDGESTVPDNLCCTSCRTSGVSSAALPAAFPCVAFAVLPCVAFTVPAGV